MVGEDEYVTEENLNAPLKAYFVHVSAPWTESVPSRWGTAWSMEVPLVSERCSKYERETQIETKFRVNKNAKYFYY
jgi:hypothetical protein